MYGNVNGDIRTATGKFQLFGTVGRNLDCRGGRIELYGKVMGSSSLAVSDDLIIGDRAIFEGPVRYWAPSDVDFRASVKNGRVVRDASLEIKRPHWYYLGSTSWLTVFWYLASALLVIILLQQLMPHFFQKAGEKVYNSMLRSLGSGILFFVATPVAIAISFISLVAIPVGLALLLGYVFALLICGSITALVAAHWFGHVKGGSGRYWEYVWIAFGFFILFRLILSIPFFGWILFPLLVCIAFGALFSSVRWKRKGTGAATSAGAVNEGRTPTLQKA